MVRGHRCCWHSTMASAPDARGLAVAPQLGEPRPALPLLRRVQPPLWPRGAVAPLCRLSGPIWSRCAVLVCSVNAPVAVSAPRKDTLAYGCQVVPPSYFAVRYTDAVLDRCGGGELFVRLSFWFSALSQWTWIRSIVLRSHCNKKIWEMVVQLGSRSRLIFGDCSGISQV
jgi:hypothetical protein